MTDEEFGVNITPKSNVNGIAQKPLICMTMENVGNFGDAHLTQNE